MKSGKILQKKKKNFATEFQISQQTAGHNFNVIKKVKINRKEANGKRVRKCEERVQTSFAYK